MSGDMTLYIMSVHPRRPHQSMPIGPASSLSAFRDWARVKLSENGAKNKTEYRLMGHGMRHIATASATWSMGSMTLNIRESVDRKPRKASEDLPPAGGVQLNLPIFMAPELVDGLTEFAVALSSGTSDEFNKHKVKPLIDNGVVGVNGDGSYFITALGKHEISAQ